MDDLDFGALPDLPTGDATVPASAVGSNDLDFETLPDLTPVAAAPVQAPAGIALPPENTDWIKPGGVAPADPKVADGALVYTMPSAKRGDGIVEGFTDPQQYKEAVKGVVPGAADFVLGTIPKGAAILDPAEAVQANMQRYIEQMRRVPKMSADELSAFRQEVEKEPAPATRTAVQSAISDLLDRSARMSDIEAQFAPATPIAERGAYKLGEAGSKFAKELIPAAPGYEDSVGRNLGEGGGSLAGGLLFSVFGPVASGVAFTTSGIGQSVESAVKFDEKEKKAGRPGISQEQILFSGLLGAGPGATDVLPVETLLGRLPLPVPQALKQPLARAITRIGGQAFIEGVQEGGQQFLQNLIAREVYDPNQPLRDQVASNAGYGAAIGAIAEGVKELAAGALHLKRRGHGSSKTETPEAVAPAPEPVAPEAPPVAPEATIVTPEPGIVTPEAPIVTPAPESVAPEPQPGGQWETNVTINGNKTTTKSPEPESAPVEAAPDGDAALAELDALLAAEPNASNQSAKINTPDSAAAAAPLEEQENLPVPDEVESGPGPSEVGEKIDIPAKPDRSAIFRDALADQFKTPTAEAIEEAAAQVNTAPTEAQAEAGNYKKGHVKVHGLDVTIETPRGAERSGKGPDGKPWSVTMPDHYGYVRRTVGADDEQVDAYLGPNPDSDKVFVVNQRDADTKEWDEHKALIGYDTPGDALAAYSNAFSDGRGTERIGSVSEMSMPEFKDWLKDRDATKEATHPIREEEAKPPVYDGSEKTIREAIASHNSLKGGAEDRLRATITPDMSVKDTLAAVSDVWGPATGSDDRARNIGVVQTNSRGSNLELHVNDGSPKGKTVKLSGKVLADHIKAMYAKPAEAKATIAKKATKAKGAIQTTVTGQQRYNPINDLEARKDVELKAAGQGRGKASKANREAMAAAERSRKEADEQLTADERDEIVSIDADRRARTDLRDFLAEVSMSDVPAEHVEAAVKIMVEHGIAAEDAYERAVSQSDADEGMLSDSDYLDSGVPFDDFEQLTAPQVEPAPNAKGEGGARPAAQEENTGVSQEPHRAGENGQGPKTKAEAVKALRSRLLEPVEMQAEDSDESVTVRLTEKGPWDFNDTFPALDFKTFINREAEGATKAFEGESKDMTVEEVVGSINESLGVIADHMGDIRTMQREIADLESGKTKVKKNHSKDEEIAFRRRRIKKANQSLRGVGAELQGRFTREGVAGMMRQARLMFSKDIPIAQTPAEKEAEKSAKIDAGFAANREVLSQFKKGTEVEFTQSGEFKQPDGSLKEGRLVRGVVTGINSKEQGTVGVDEHGGGNWNVAARNLRLAKATTEKTAAGTQTVLPGAEKIGQGEQAQRKADEKLKPKVTQKDVGGLFGDDSKQIDLMDALAKPAKSAAVNVGQGLADVAKGLDALFSPKGKLGSGPTFDEETYAKAKPLFKSGVAHFVEAGRDVADLIRELVRYLAQTAKLDQATIANMEPYVLRFMDDVEAGKIDLTETPNAPSSSGNLESDSGERAAANPVGGTDVSAPGGRSRQGAGKRGSADRTGKPDKSEDRRDLPQDYAPVVGADGHLELPAREPGSEKRAAPDRERAGSDRTGDEGLPLERAGDIPASTAAGNRASLAERKRAQAAAEPIKVRPGIENIRETLPLLLPEQQDDVLKAEARFAKPDGNGMLFTNGTGTGKTFIGAGVIKRFTKQNKNNILVVAPSQGILLDWQKALQEFGIKAHILDSIEDKGNGVTLTTFSNVGDNQNLVDRDWELVIPDEAQKLSSGQDGEPTAALNTIRALTLHPRGLQDRAKMVFKKEWAAVEALDPKTEHSAWNMAYKAFFKVAEPAIEKWQGQTRPKALFLSATPFSYHFSLDWAEGYLFDYGPEPTSSAYNTPDARGQFYVQNFGYRMRTGKLTKPEADVKSEIMERQFHEKLKKSGALSGRALEVDKDYDRKFIVVDDAVGNKIDAALEFLSSADDGKFRPLSDPINKKFDYLSRMRLLEAIKARHAVPYIKKSLALGRKVVVFHDYNEGGGFSPFDLRFAPDAKVHTRVDGKDKEVNANELYQEFLSRNPGVKELDFSGYLPPIAELTKAFPNALVYNGTISKKARDQAKAKFNDDNSGNDVIIVQSAAGEFGISLHDTTGHKQRVELNLGMPIRPTSAIQQEGRIYRVNQASDALFRYMNTGTNWERWTFAGKIAERAGTAENLALGNQARTMRQSFIDAFDQADTNDPAEGEGTGGKALDRANNETFTEFEKAKTHYFAQQKTRGRRDQREGADYFATPEPVGLKMVEFADIQPGDKVAEPSAGHGAISRYFPEDTARTLIEPSSSLASRAALTSPGSRVIVDRFENLAKTNKYNAIVMNPPFGHGGATAIAHVAKAATHLANGGRIVALIPRGGSADKAYDKFMEEQSGPLGLYEVGNIAMPAVTFERAGTAVNTRIVVLEKQTQQADASKLQGKTRDYSEEETIGALFNRIENAEMPKRIEPSVKEQIVEDGKPVAMTIGTAELLLHGSATYSVASLENKVGAQTFKHLAKAAEAAGGRYSKPAKAFLFPSPEARQKFVELASKPAEAAAPGAPIGGIALTTGETVHAKTGANLFVASISDRVERAVYDQASAAAKAHGGYYSSFRGNGAIPGFQFKTAEARKAFMDEVSGAPKDAALDDLDAILGPKASVSEPFRLTALAEQKRDKLEAALTAEANRIAGTHNVTVRFADRLSATEAGLAAHGSAAAGKTEAAGLYWPADRLIEVALGNPDFKNPRSTTYHEAFHAVEDLLLTDPELAVLQKADAALRDVVRQKFGLTPQQVTEVEPEEIRAMAFQVYASARANQEAIAGLSGAVRRVFEKLRLIFARIKSLLAGQGFRTVESVFGDAYTGKMAGRAAQPRWGYNLSRASVAEPNRLPDFIAGNIPAEDIAPGDATWAKLGAYLAKTFTPDRRALMALEAAGRGTGTLSPTEQAVVDRLKTAAGSAPKPAPVAVKPAAPAAKAPVNTAPSSRGPVMAPAARTNMAKVDLTPEVVAERLADRNLPKLAKISRALQVGKANPVEVRVVMQDKFLRWQRLQEDVIAATGSPIPESQDVYQTESLYYGKTGQRLETLDNDTIDPLIADIKNRGLTLEGVDEFLMARHAPERNDVIRQINPDIADPSGMSDQEAADIINKVDASGKRADYDAVEKRVRQMIDDSRQHLVDGGLISQQTADGWQNTYQNYVPLRGWAEGIHEDDTEGNGTGKGFNIMGKESKRALGRRSISDSPLGYAMTQAQQAIVRAEKNRVGQTALRFVEAHPDPDLWKVDSPEQTRRIDPQTGLVTYGPDPFWKTKDNVFAVKVGGKEHFITFEGGYGKNLARALKNLGTANMNGVMRFIAAIIRIQARLATSWNPEFMIPNFIRDIGEAFVNLQENEQKRFVKQFAKHLLPAVGGSFNALRGADGGKYAQAFREFDAAGGRIRFFGLEGVDDIKANVASKMRRLEGGVINNARQAAERAVAAIEIANGSIENATRLAAYMAARDVGMSEQRAASLAREMTVNFNRKGEYGSVISALYMFANAAMQGQTRMAGAMKNKKVRRFAYGLAATGALLAAYNMGAGGDDDDGTPYYLKLAPWIRDNNLILMWPKGMGHDGKYISIPLPYGYAMFHVIGARMATLFHKKEPGGKAVSAMIKSVLDSFDPLGKDENTLAQFSPTLVKPAVHLATNKNWTGRPISPEPQFYNKHEPDSSRTFRTTSEFAQGLAQGLNKATGGDKHTPGWLDFTPGSIDYMLNFTTGGLGRFAKNTFDTTARAVNGQEWQPEKTPILRRFFGDAKSEAGDRAVYFEAREAVQNADRRSKAYAKDRDPVRRAQFIKENSAEISSASRFAAVDKERKKILIEIDRIKATPGISAADREKQIKVQEKRELLQMGRALRLLEDKRNGRSPGETETETP